MNLRDYLRVLRKRWKLIALALIVCVGLGVGLTVITTKKYQATAQLFVSSVIGDSNISAQNQAQGNNFSAARVQSYTSVANSYDVAVGALTLLHTGNLALPSPPSGSVYQKPATPLTMTPDPSITLTPTQLLRAVSANAPTNKTLLNVQVVDKNPEHAAELAAAVAKSMSQYIAYSLEQTTSQNIPDPNDSSKVIQQLTPSVQLTVFKLPSIPSTPITPRTKLYIAISVLVGLLLGIALAATRELLDNTVKSPEELREHAETPVLGAIPWDKRVSDHSIAFRGDSHGLRAEAFRQLRTNLQFVDVDHPPRIITVTSALPNEGKTHTALNLAAALAEAGQRVCLIEADLRKPTIADTLGMVRDVGLTSVLIGKATVEDVLQNSGHNLAVMTSGPVPPNPSELLVSEQCRKVLAYVATKVDVVVVDTAPLLPVADGAEMAALGDATLLTVRAGKTTREQIHRAISTLNNVGVHPVGTILSMASRQRAGSYDYYYYEYRPQRSGHAQGDDAKPGKASDRRVTPIDEEPAAETEEHPVLSGTDGRTD